MATPSTTGRRCRAARRASARNDQVLSGSVEDPKQRGETQAAVNLLTDIEEFVHDHRPHGTLTADATDGYLLTVACPCGVVFERWVTSVDADLDLLHSTLLN